MEDQKAYVINATTSEIQVSVNSKASSLGAVALDSDNPQKMIANNSAVPYTTGSDVFGSFCTGGTRLVLTGPQYSSQNPPTFDVTINQNTIPPESSFLMIWVMRLTISVTDQNGNVAGITVKAADDNPEAKSMLRLSPNVLEEA